MADIEINGVAPSTYGFDVVEIEGVLTSPSQSLSPYSLAGRAGQRVGLRRTSNKPFSVRFLMTADTLADASSQLDYLNDVCMGGAPPSTVIFAWSTTRRLSAECLGVSVSPAGPAFGLFKYFVTAMFDAPNPPFWEASTQFVVNSVGATDATLAMGNAPVWPKIRVLGPSTDPVLTLKNSSGTEVASMTFSGVTLTSTEYLNVDMDALTVYINDSGAFSTGTNSIDTFSTGDFFNVKSEYFNYIASSWATLSLTDGTTAANGTATVHYNKAWY